MWSKSHMASDSLCPLPASHFKGSWSFLPCVPSRLLQTLGACLACQWSSQSVRVGGQNALGNSQPVGSGINVVPSVLREHSLESSSEGPGGTEAASPAALIPRGLLRHVDVLLHCHWSLPPAPWDRLPLKPPSPTPCLKFVWEII